MTVRLLPDGAIELLGNCPSEDAEQLLQLLLADPSAAVDWAGCEAAHTAVIQVLVVARPQLKGSPGGPELRDWVAPLLMPRDP